MATEVVFPDWLKVAQRIMQDDPWVYEPFESKLARELEKAYEMGVSRERMRQLEMKEDNENSLRHAFSNGQ